MNEKKGQIQLTFNWIYILVAGVIILLFFVGIVFRGKVVAEQHLEEDVLRITESIFVGAGVSEKTKNFVDVSGLKDFTLVFGCEEGYTGFGVKDGTFRELPVQPIFAPKEVKTTQLILWSLPYKMPYKVMDLLMLTSVNTKYFVVGEGQFKTELMNSTEGFNFEFVGEGEYDTIEPGNNQHVRVIYLNSLDVGDFGNIPAKLNVLGTEQLSAVEISGGKATYYQKVAGNARWVQEGEAIPIISLGGEKDAAKYGAIFAGDGESYKCNMMKVFERLQYLNEIYAGKLAELLDYYSQFGVPNKESCQLILVEQENDVRTAFNAFRGAVPSCKLDYNFCGGIVELASNLQTLNKDLNINCIPLY